MDGTWERTQTVQKYGRKNLKGRDLPEDVCVNTSRRIILKFKIWVGRVFTGFI
jgi:hypothetical protein